MKKKHLDDDKMAMLTDKVFQVIHASEYEKIVHDRAVLFCVPYVVIEKLDALDKSIKNSAVGQIEKEGLKNVIKLFNKSSACYKYSLSMKHKYQNISDPEKVKERLLGTFETSARTKQKLFEKNLETTDAYSESEITQKRNELGAHITEKRNEINEIFENFDDYNIVITNFIDNLTYPYLYYTTADGKSQGENLRVSVPNVLWFDEDAEKGLNRSDAKMLEVVSTYTNVLDRIFIKRKDT